MGWMYHPIKASRLRSQSHLLQVGGPKQGPRLKLTTGEGARLNLEQTESRREQEESTEEQKGARGSRREQKRAEEEQDRAKREQRGFSGRAKRRQPPSLRSRGFPEIGV